MAKKDEAVNWVPDLNYYIYLVRRMQDSILFQNILVSLFFVFFSFVVPKNP